MQICTSEAPGTGPVRSPVQAPARTFLTCLMTQELLGVAKVNLGCIRSSRSSVPRFFDRCHYEEIGGIAWMIEITVRKNCACLFAFFILFWNGKSLVLEISFLILELNYQSEIYRGTFSQLNPQLTRQFVYLRWP